MCSDWKILLILFLLLTASCNVYRKVQDISAGRTIVKLSISDEKPLKSPQEDTFSVDSIRSTLTDGPILMKAIKDSETGEMVATDVINASRVVARFRNVAERGGYVSIGFDVIVPETMMDSRFQLKLRPSMTMLNDTIPLDAVFVTGSRYRSLQLRGYERYRAFLSTIITDTTDFIRVGQLEVFLKRNFPDIYAMKSDSTIVSDALAESVFGLTQEQAVRHYTNQFMVRINENRKKRAVKLRDRHIKDPIVTEGIRLDTVLTTLGGDFIYRYVHTFRTKPFLKKVGIMLTGDLYEEGEQVSSLAFSDGLTFYISSLSSLLDERPRYRIVIRERIAYDNTKALLDFRLGSASLDTTLGDNASEILRIKKCIDDVLAKEEYQLDSLLITASCSMEGRYEFNKRLSRARANTVLDVLSGYVPPEWKELMRTSDCPENWGQFFLLVENDQFLPESVKRRIGEVRQLVEKEPDRAEQKLSLLPEYRYLREKIYPQLRSVSFDFHLHRKGMVKDTTHTSEVDSVYMAGMEAIRNIDYKKAVALLRPYRDYNSALAFMLADYNHSALDVLRDLDGENPRVCYLLALVLSRLRQDEEALKYLKLSVALEPSIKFRVNLDPEMSKFINDL